MNGAVNTKNGGQQLFNYTNHAINYQTFPSGEVIAFDLTAAQNIDREMGNFDVLAIGAKDMDTLLTRLNNLYGGTWKEIPKEKINLYYWLGYGTPAQKTIARELLFKN